MVEVLTHRSVDAGTQLKCKAMYTNQNGVVVVGDTQVECITICAGQSRVVMAGIAQFVCMAIVAN